MDHDGEKCALKFWVGSLFSENHAEGRYIAGKRAAAAGVHLTDLVGSENEMQNNFTAAEAAALSKFFGKLRFEVDMENPEV
ncbi:MAG: hypothetical protein R6X05_15095 [Desulfobacterales bacterium]